MDIVRTLLEKTHSDPTKTIPGRFNWYNSLAKYAEKYLIWR